MSNAAILAQATALLTHVRETPMARGGRWPEATLVRCRQVAENIESRGVKPRLAGRLARQLVIKCTERELGSPPVWAAIGDVIRQEALRLERDLGFVERQL